MRVRIYVFAKDGVLDPQGEAIERSLRSLGYAEVRAVRAGKCLDLDLGEISAAAAQTRVREMCEKLLANPVIEDYRIELLEG
jgi:phosphoribosylformylglycinamidine synthase PurS subunit